VDVAPTALSTTRLTAVLRDRGSGHLCVSGVRDRESAHHSRCPDRTRSARWYRAAGSLAIAVRLGAKPDQLARSRALALSRHGAGAVRSSRRTRWLRVRLGGDDGPRSAGPASVRRAPRWLADVHRWLVRLPRTLRIPPRCRTVSRDGRQPQHVRAL